MIHLWSEKWKLIWCSKRFAYRTYHLYRQHLNVDALALRCLAVRPIAFPGDLPPEKLHNTWISWWCMVSKMISNWILPRILCSLQTCIRPDGLAFALYALRLCTCMYNQIYTCRKPLENISTWTYHPANIGINDNNAGDIHVFSIMMATTFFVMVMGYFNGFTMA